MSGIVTFYSYKGGVGRTMAMANVAVLLALRGLKVLVVDWDLEAPGLERYFGYFTVRPAKGGLLRLLQEQKRGSRGYYRSHLARVSGKIGTQSFELDLLPSGRELDSKYSQLLEGFDWERYFEAGGGDFIEELRSHWCADYDVTLIDSRTGLSDTGGICTIQMPDTVVALFTANYQSLYGVRDTLQLARSARDRLAYDRMHLRILPVPARFSLLKDTPEANEWLGRIADVLGPFYNDWLAGGAAARQMAQDLSIPQIDSFGFGEKLAVVEQDQDARDPMTAVYTQIADLLTRPPTEADAVTRFSIASASKHVTPATTRSGARYEHDIFISYATGSVLDEWLDLFLIRLGRVCEQKLGRPLRVFMDRSQIRLGAAWTAEMSHTLLHSRTLLAIVTPEFLDSNWCRAQWATFELREVETVGTVSPILPLLLRSPESMPPWLAQRQMLDLTSLPRQVSAFKRRSKAMDAALQEVATHIVKRIRATARFNPTLPAIAPNEVTNITPQQSPLPLTPEQTLDTDAIIALLKTDGRPETLLAARRLLQESNKKRDFANVVRIGEALRAQSAEDVQTNIMYARGLLQTGQPRLAEKVLVRLLKSQKPPADEYFETSALLGQAYKQIYVENRSNKSAAASSVLLRAIDLFHKAYQADPNRVWHGVNLVALLSAARRHSLNLSKKPSAETVALDLLRRLEQIPSSIRDRNYDWNLAELYLGLGKQQDFEQHLRRYLAVPERSAFELNGVLRQLTEIWELQATTIIDGLRARILNTAGGSVDVTSSEVQPTAAKARSEPALERIFGSSGVATHEWWKAGLESARSVGAVSDALGHRHGTCFLASARDLGIDLDGVVAITPDHLVARSDGPVHAQNAVFTFEIDGRAAHAKVAKELWRSPLDRLDAVVFQLHPQPQLPGLPLARMLPLTDVPQRVYLIGHPGGRGLALSFQDNELLDHEDIPGVSEVRPNQPVRLHYRAPTEAGSSGSPVFNQLWQVIAMHRMKSSALPRLNGKTGTYAASEGVWIQSIVQAIKARP